MSSAPSRKLTLAHLSARVLVRQPFITSALAFPLHFLFISLLFPLFLCSSIWFFFQMTSPIYIDFLWFVFIISRVFSLSLSFIALIFTTHLPLFKLISHSSLFFRHYSLFIYMSAFIRLLRPSLLILFKPTYSYFYHLSLSWHSLSPLSVFFISISIFFFFFF